MAIPSTTWRPLSASMGTQPIAQVSTTAQHNIGQRVRALDYTYGEVECIYLPCASAAAAGDLVTFDEKNGLTAQAVRGSRGAVAVAMAAGAASSFGWFAVSGTVPVAAVDGVSKLGQAFLTTTAGSVSSLQAEGEQVDGMSLVTQPSSGFITCRLSSPSADGGFILVSEKVL